MKKEIKRIYIAGSISSDIAEDGYLKCYNKFDKQEKSVLKMFPDAVVYNPMKFCKADWGWLRCMIKCVFILVFKCDFILLMPDYTRSKGATIEKKIAEFFKLTFMFFNQHRDGTMLVEKNGAGTVTYRFHSVRDAQGGEAGASEASTGAKRTP